MSCGAIGTINNDILDIGDLAQDLNLILDETHEPELEELALLERKLLLALYLTKTLKNAKQAAVNKLPTEILGHIFISTLPSPPLIYSSPLKEVLLLTQVCRQWRSVARSTPLLWNRIHINADCPVESISSLLEYSGNMPLSVSYAQSNSNDQSTKSDDFDLFIGHTTRLEELHIYMDRIHTMPYWSKLVQPAPNLKTLTLRSPDIYGPAITERDELPCLFSDHLPSLERLVLSNFLLWNNNFSNLRSLVIYDYIPTRSNATGPSLDAFLNGLSSSPLLEELTIVRAIPYIPSPEIRIPSRHVVRLPYLRSLALGGMAVDLNAVAMLHASFIIPDTAARYVWTDYRPLDLPFYVHSQAQEDIRRDVTELPARMEIRKLEIVHSHSAHKWMAMFSLENETLTFTSNHDWLNYGQLFTLGLVDKVEEFALYYNEEPIPDINHLRLMFQALPLLRRLVVIVSHPRPLLSNIAIALGTIDSGPGLIVCPLLDTVELYYHPTTDKKEDEDTHLDIMSLIHLAEKRKAESSPLRHVIVERGYEGQVERLRESMVDGEVTVIRRYPGYAAGYFEDRHFSGLLEKAKELPHPSL